MAKTALLIGGGGSTGGHIANGLARRGYDVSILHRGVHEPTEIAGFPHLHADPHFEAPVRAAIGPATYDVVVATYGRIATLAPIFAGRCGQFISIGGIPIYDGYLDPQSARPAGTRLPTREDSPLAQPASMRLPGTAKFASKMLAAEQAVMDAHARGAYAATIFRYPIVYGPISIAGVEWSVMKRVRDGRPFVLAPCEGLGIISRCSAANAAHAVLLAVGAEAAAGEIFNCADDHQYSLGQWLQMIVDAMGGQAEIVGLPRHLTWAASHMVPLSGTITEHCIADTSKARRLLGYCDIEPAREALAGLVAYRLATPPSDEEVRGWADPFDYALEDDIKRRLDEFRAECDRIARVEEAVHPYPHPKAPSLEADHRGR